MYKPPFDITNLMLDRVSAISEKIGKISSFSQLNKKPHLRRNSRIKSIHSSLKIEANSLSFRQVRDVIDGVTVLGKQNEIQEVKNAYLAYDNLFNINPTSIKDLKSTHKMLTQNLINDSGMFRSGEEGVFQDGKCIFVAPPAIRVNTLVKDLLQWLKSSKKQVHPLIASSIFHYELVFIHPFSDGNGRVARLWHTVILYNWKSVFEYVPIESQIEKFQKEYYEAIADSHANGNSNVFIEFMLYVIDQALDDVIRQIDEDNNELSIYVNRLLRCMKYDMTYTSATLLKKLKLKSKETLRKNYINPALKLGLIEMTIPDKPRSKNQRYKKI